MNQNILSQEYLRNTTPSIFAEVPEERMSERYSFIPTYKILEGFEKQNWFPTQANQQRTKKDDRQFRRHVVRLSNPDIQAEMKEAGSITPQIVIMNSHNGTSNLRMEIGLFRLVCSNGLIVADSRFAQIRRRHIGVEQEEMFQIIQDATKEFGDIWNKIDEYRSIQLTNGQRFDFARKVVDFHWGENSIIDPKSLLVPKRSMDELDDIFTIMNVLQENIMKGGVKYENQRTQRLRNTRKITSADSDMKINQFLWMLIERFRITKKF